MRRNYLLTLSVTIFVIAGGVAWAVLAFRNNAPNILGTGVTQNQLTSYVSQRTNQSPATLMAKQPTNSSTSHLYSPLHDPPPLATSEQLRKWREDLNSLFLKGFLPDLSGPALLSIYAREAANAENGDIQAGTALFKGLYYCREEAMGTLESKGQLDGTIRHMRETQTDRWGASTNNLADSIIQIRAQYHYCAGFKSAEISSNTSSWAALAFRSSDPDIAFQAGLYMSGLDLGATTPLQLYDKQQEIINGYARLGLPYAWQLKWERDEVVNKKPETAYAELYTEYMLTRSPFLAHKVWELSQQLNALQIEQAEAQAHKNYQEIQSH